MLTKKVAAKGADLADLKKEIADLKEEIADLKKDLDVMKAARDQKRLPAGINAASFNIFRQMTAKDLQGHIFLKEGDIRKHRERIDVKEKEIRTLQEQIERKEAPDSGTDQSANNFGTKFYDCLQAAKAIPCKMSTTTHPMMTVKLPAGAEWCIEPAIRVLFDRTAIHDELWKRVNVLPAGGRLLVMGNPGIGKSWSLNALLWRHVNANPNDPVVVLDLSGWHFIDEQHCYRRFDIDDGLALSNLLCTLYPKQRRRVLLLHDCKSTDSKLPFKEHIVVRYRGYATVLAASPDRHNYKDFEKQDDMYHQFFFPLWDYSELICAKPAITPDEFSKGGGVLRSYDRCTGKMKDHFLLRQDTEAAAFDYSGEKLDVSHIKGSNCIIALYPDADFKKYTVGFVSNEASRKWAQQQRARSYESMQRGLAQMMMNNATRSVTTRYPFEEWVHGRLTQKGDAATHWPIYPLDGVPARVELLPHPAVDEQQVNDFSACPPNTTAYYRPKASNFACFDALFVSGTIAWLVQTTLNTAHPVKAAFMDSYDALFNNGFRDIRILFVTDMGSKLTGRQSCDTTQIRHGVSVEQGKKKPNPLVIQELSSKQARANATFVTIPQFHLRLSLMENRLLRFTHALLRQVSVWVPDPNSTKDMLDVYDRVTPSVTSERTRNLMRESTQRLATDVEVKIAREVFYVP